MATSPTLGITLFEADMENGDVALSDAIWTIDVFGGQNPILDEDLSTPPGSPADGDLYIVAGTGTGDWAGQDGDLAAYHSGDSEWRFLTPTEGMTFWVSDDNDLIVYDGSSWQIAFNGT